MPYMPISWGGLGCQCRHIYYIFHTWSVWACEREKKHATHCNSGAYPSSTKGLLVAETAQEFQGSPLTLAVKLDKPNVVRLLFASRADPDGVTWARRRRLSSRVVLEGPCLEGHGTFTALKIIYIYIYIYVNHPLV